MKMILEILGSMFFYLSHEGSFKFFFNAYSVKQI